VQYLRWLRTQLATLHERYAHVLSTTDGTRQPPVQGDSHGVFVTDAPSQELRTDRGFLDGHPYANVGQPLNALTDLVSRTSTATFQADGCCELAPRAANGNKRLASYISLELQVRPKSTPKLRLHVGVEPQVLNRPQRLKSEQDELVARPECIGAPEVNLRPIK
jgi:hypothetical protein